MNKNENDGWIEWHGGDRPIHGDAFVEIETIFGKCSGYASRFDWNSLGDDFDIIAYRIIEQ